MVDWKVFYADGSTYSSKDGPPEKAPKDYAEVVMQYEPFRDRRDIISGAGTTYQYYCWHGDRWIIHDDSGLEQYNALFKDKAIVLRGFYIEDEKFWAIHQQAVDDPEWKAMETRLVRASQWAVREVPGTTEAVSVPPAE